MRVIPVVRLGSFLFIGDKYSMDGYIPKFVYPFTR